MLQDCQAHRTESMLKPSPQVNRSGGRDEPALTVQSLFDAEETPLLRYALSLVGRREVAEEIVQEVFLQLHIHWEEIDSPRAWLFQSVRNRVYNHVRDHRREVLHSDNGSTQCSKADLESPEKMLVRMEVSGSLRQLLEELDQSDQQLVHLKYFEGLKYRDISTKTGLSAGNIGYRLHHILKELARKLRPLEIDDIS